MKFVFSIAVAFLLVLASPVLASGNYTTPEYSGPSARIDHGGMAGSEPMVPRRAPIGPAPSDLGFENRVEDRAANITREQDRRRDESIRINQDHILKTNE